MQAYHEFSEEVTFIGLTRVRRQDAERFVRQAGIPWPNGYGADDTIDKISGSAPTILVIDPQGRIAWHDSHSRLDHDEIAGLSQLKTVLEALLAGEPLLSPPDRQARGSPTAPDPKAPADSP